MIGFLATSGYDRQDFSAAGLRAFKRFQHQSPGAFRHDKTIPVLGKGLGRFFRVVVLGREGGEEREADERFNGDGTIGANTQGGICLAAPDGFNTHLNGRGARSARR